MKGREKLTTSRVLKVDSEESWDFYLTQANNQGCPVVVHFTASWCVPSVAMNHFFEDLANTYQDILFLLVDVDEVKDDQLWASDQGVASKMEVKAMPTFMSLKEGAQVDKIIGANPEETRKRIDRFALSIRSSKHS